MLNYKASNIAKAERETNSNFFKTVEGLGDGAPRMADILFVLQAGGLTEDAASDLLDEKGMADAMALVVEGLGEAGFLAKAMEAQKANPLPKATESTGDKTKA